MITIKLFLILQLYLLLYYYYSLLILINITMDMDNRRKTSLGKSTFVESAISIIYDLQNSDKGDLKLLMSLALDKSLINEIRSVAWRIFLGILSNKNLSEWVRKSKEHRKHFDEGLQSISNESDYIDSPSEETVKHLHSNTLEVINLLHSIVKEESTKSMIYNSLSESAQKIYLIWLRGNPLSNQDHIRISFRILLVLMFALYPSIINVSSQDCDIKESSSQPSPKELLYFLNSEDYFDADVYTIFSEIMRRGVKDLITSATTEDKDLYELFNKVQSCNNKGKHISKVVANLGRSEIDLVYYLGVCREELVQKAANKHLELRGLLTNMTSSLFYDHDFEVLIYFWDCLLACENNCDFVFSKVNKHQSGLAFSDFLACALLANTNYSLFESSEKLTQTRIFKNQLDEDVKAIVHTALKLREKIINHYEEEN